MAYGKKMKGDCNGDCGDMGDMKKSKTRKTKKTMKKKNATKKGGNPWLAHLSRFWSKNKTKMSYKEAMKKAKATYKK
tara:strand:+ start:64 stop:294 length:231 start_codon:yes stop_codon:yes gene_type:complete